MIDKKNKKKFAIPEAVVIDFADDDIVTISGVDEAAGWEEGEDFE